MPSKATTTARTANAAAGPVAAKKATPRKAVKAAVVAAAQTAVSIDLDALEREAPTEPFTFRLGAQVFHLHDPVEMAWQDSIRALENPALYLDLMLPEAERETFYGILMPTWKLQALMRDYLTHFGLPVPGESDALQR